MWISSPSRRLPLNADASIRLPPGLEHSQAQEQVGVGGGRPVRKSGNSILVELVAEAPSAPPTATPGGTGSEVPGGTRHLMSGIPDG